MSPRRKGEQPAPTEQQKRRTRQPKAAPEPAAQPAAEVPEAPRLSSDRIVVFRLAGKRYALPIERVQEIQQIVAFTEVPDPTEALLGIVNLRGAVVPLVDMRLLLGMEPRAYGLETPMIICRAHGSLVAVLVDEVDDVLAIPEDCLRPPPRPHALASRLLGVCRLEPDLVFLLDLDRVMPAEAFAEREVST